MTTSPHETLTLAAQTVECLLRGETLAEPVNYESFGEFHDLIWRLNLMSAIDHRETAKLWAVEAMEFPRLEAMVTGMNQEGLVRPSDLFAVMKEWYDRGAPQGVSPGWASLAREYRVLPTEMTVITGTPSAGKSRFLTAMLTHIAKNDGWKCLLFSPEMSPPQRHLELLLTQYIGKPFRRGEIGRMSWAEAEEGLQWANRHFTWLWPKTQPATMPYILNMAKYQALTNDISAVVIDPWNRISHRRSEKELDTAYIGDCLGQLSASAQTYGYHQFIVAHPTKVFKSDNGKFPVVTPNQIAGCYSDDTEVLTKRGWLRHDQLTLEDSIACFDLKNNAMTYAQPSRIIAKPYDGDMLRFKGYGYDLLVTPEHRMVIKPQWHAEKPQRMRACGWPRRWSVEGWSFCQASEIPRSEFDIPLAAPLSDAPTDDVPIDLARLAGWYVSEGSAMSAGISIAQAIGPKANAIEQLLQDMGLSYSARDTKPGGKGGTLPGRQFYLPKRHEPAIISWLRHECGMGSQYKHVPRAIQESSGRIKQAFLETYLAGDGNPSSYGNGACVATTTSPQLRDDLQRLCLEIGLAVSWDERILTSDKHATAWQINIARPERTKTAMYTKRNRTTHFYHGMVYCLTVPTGAYFVRRHGKSVICGNSANFWNMPENVLSVRRDLDNDSNHTTEIHIQKVRWSENGRMGRMVELYYHPETARYSELTHAPYATNGNYR